MRYLNGFGVLAIFGLLTGCSASAGSDGESGGANSSSGGAHAAGGASSVGGSASAGTAGSAVTGGSSGAGGSVTSGGTSSAGGSAGTSSSAGTASGGTGTVVIPEACSGAEGGAVNEPAGTVPDLTAGEWKQITPPGICAGAHFGCMDIHVHPCNTAILYLTTDVEGMWKSEDAGATWSEIGDFSGDVSPGVMQINPADPSQMYYIGGVRGSTVGFWKSSDGGDHWSEPAGFTSKANNSADGWTNDVYDVKADPADFNHVLITFHSPWNWTESAGVLISEDGGESWTRSNREDSWGQGHSVYFLNDSSTWLLGTQGNGYWKTTDAGQSWTQVTDRDMQHGGTAAYYSKTGVLYVGALGNILRSTDNGDSFTFVAPNTGDGYYDIIGDGNFMYASLANTGSHGGDQKPYVVTDEDDGVTWTDYNGQTFVDGPYRMDFDPINRIVYSANWNGGVWALKVQDL